MEKNRQNDREKWSEQRAKRSEIETLQSGTEQSDDILSFKLVLLLLWNER